LRHHPEKAAHGLVNDQVLAEIVRGQPGTGIGQQPAPPVDPDRAVQDGDGLVAERVAVLLARRQADQDRPRPVPPRMRPHGISLGAVAAPRIPPTFGIPATACLR
jgi:hypothetical protein